MAPAQQTNSATELAQGFWALGNCARENKTISNLAACNLCRSAYATGWAKQVITLFDDKRLDSLSVGY
jgi:hypothetical protein